MAWTHSLREWDQHLAGRGRGLARPGEGGEGVLHSRVSQHALLKTVEQAKREKRSEDSHLWGSSVTGQRHILLLLLLGKHWGCIYHSIGPSGTLSQWLITAENKLYFAFLTVESFSSDPCNKKKKCKIRQISSVPEVHEQIRDVLPLQESPNCLISEGSSCIICFP